MWFFEALVLRMGGYWMWERSTPCSSWSEARRFARDLELVGYRTRTVYVAPSGQVVT